jgi:hydroxypyruvate isomerase
MNDGHGRSKVSRRTVVAAGGAAVAAILGRGASSLAADDKGEEGDTPLIRHGRINQAICPGVVGRGKLQSGLPRLAKMGIKGIDLLAPDQFGMLKGTGLICTMTRTHSLTKGLNRKENHAECLAKIREAIEATAEAGFPNVITFPGNRAGMADDEGLKNCAVALKQVVGLAETKKVTICMELLNSKLNHKDYMCDHTAWGAELVKAVGSDRFRLLYDIYHMQVQEGDIIATIRKYKDCIGHYHTAGVPGRNEIDETQELYYPAIMRAIVETGYKGYVAHEYGPKRDPMTSLAKAIRICDV